MAKQSSRNSEPRFPSETRSLPVDSAPAALSRRMFGWAARNHSKTACPAGHRYTPENTYLHRGWRYCLTCKRQHARRSEARSGQRRERKAWRNAIYRCTNPRHPKYPHYGGRGIFMCSEWMNSFAAFFRDMGPCQAGLSLDRINNDGPYAPGNCRWTDCRTQLANRRQTRR
jgi:hypothetical protein